MNKKPDGDQSFAFNDLTLKQPAISDSLTFKQPAISDSLTLKQPAISDNLTQMLIHHLTLPDFNHHNEDLR